MHSKALFVTMQAGPGNGDKVAEWLRGALTPIENEPATRDWYALRMAPETFAIFDTFDGHRGRLTHLLGKVGRGLVVRTFTLLSGLPDIRMADVLAARVPPQGVRLTRAVHSTLSTHNGHSAALTALLKDEMQQQETDQSASYALRLAENKILLLDFLAEGPGGAAAHDQTALAKRVSGLCDVIATDRSEILAYKYV